MKRKILFTIAFVLAMAVIAVLMLYQYVKSDPNMIMKKFARTVTVDQPEEISYKYTGKRLIGTDPIPEFKFTPEESAEYRFEITDMASEENVVLTMSVMDSNMSDYLVVSNNGDEGTEEDAAEAVAGDVYLQKARMCYIVIDAYSDTDDKETFSGSFTFKVSKAPDEEKKAVLTEDAPVTVNVREGEHTGVVFTPTQAGYYKFDADIVSKDEALGFAAVDAVTEEDNSEITVTDGICHLEADKEYFLWVSVSETSKKNSKVSLSGKLMATETLSGIGTAEVPEAVVIEFTPDTDGPLIIYSESEGDPEASLYDSNYFPLRSDKNSGGALSGNDKDFAMVFNAEAGKTYAICVEGDMTGCKVHVARYTGDGTSLGPDDIQTEDVTGSEEEAGTETDNTNEEE